MDNTLVEVSDAKQGRRVRLTVANVAKANRYTSMAPYEAADALRKDGFDVPRMDHFFLYVSEATPGLVTRNLWTGYYAMCGCPHFHGILIRSMQGIVMQASDNNQFYGVKDTFKEVASTYLQMQGPHMAIVEGHGYGIPERNTINALEESGFEIDHLQNENARYEYHGSPVQNPPAKHPLLSSLLRPFVRHEVPAVVLRQGKESPIFCVELHTDPYYDVIRTIDGIVELPIRQGEDTVSSIRDWYQSDYVRNLMVKALGVDRAILDEIWTFSLWKPEPQNVRQAESTKNLYT